MNRVKRLPPSGSEENFPAVGKLPVVVFSKVQTVSLTQLRVGSVLFPNSVSKFPFVTGMVVACAEAIKALSPMAAMPRPQSLRTGRMFLGGAAWPGGAMWCMFGMLVMDVVVMVLGSMDCFSWYFLAGILMPPARVTVQYDEAVVNSQQGNRVTNG